MANANNPLGDDARARAVEELLRQHTAQLEHRIGAHLGSNHDSEKYGSDLILKMTYECSEDIRITALSYIIDNNINDLSIVDRCKILALHDPSDWVRILASTAIYATCSESARRDCIKFIVDSMINNAEQSEFARVQTYMVLMSPSQLIKTKEKIVPKFCLTLKDIDQTYLDNLLEIEQ